MARPLRVEFAGGCYHVINRGNYRRDLFGQGGGAEAFERTLAEAAERFGWGVHAYVVMRNHFHLAIGLSEPNLSDGMQWLQGTWIVSGSTDLAQRKRGRNAKQCGSSDWMCWLGRPESTWAHRPSADRPRQRCCWPQ